MSVNQIDVNAVNKRALEQKHAGSTPEMLEEKQTENVVRLAKLIKGSLRWRLAYFLVRFIMVLESIVWTIMDALRAWRMRVAERINDNYN